MASSQRGKHPITDPSQESSAKKKRRSSDDATSATSDVHVGFIGCGNVAQALVEGFVGEHGKVLPSTITASATSINSANLKKMKEFGVSMTTVNRDVILCSDIIIISVKPYQILDVLSEIQEVYSRAESTSKVLNQSPRNPCPLVVSVAAAIPICDMDRKTEITCSVSGGSPTMEHLPIIRCVPTLLSSVGAGMTTYARGKFCSEADAKPFVMLFSLCGHCEEVPEKYLNAFTTFGSGIAFTAMVVEAMTDGGVLVGVPRPMAQRVIANNVMGSAKMILEKGLHPGQLKDAVASPGGTTIHGIQALERAGLRSALIEAFKASTDRAEEMRS